MKMMPAPAPPIDLIFRAFADRTRLRILYLLQGGECCVGNLVDVLDIEQPSASRHLAYLRRARLVSVRKAGLWSYYSLAPATLPFHQKLLECLACCFSAVPEMQADQARARQVRQGGGCCPGEERARGEAAPKRKKIAKADDCCPA
jgi:ArsR family transcriptional regulator